MGRARVAVAAAAAALALPASAPAEITAVPSAHAIVTLDPDGVLEMLEQMNVRADGPTAAAWEITMRRGELFAQPSLFVDDRRYRAGDGRRAGTFRISRGTRGIRFDWPQPRGAGSVRLAYRLALLGTAYADVVDLRVPVWEGDWPVAVQTFSAALKLPRPARGRVFAWVDEGEIAARVTKTRRDVRLRVSRVPPRTPVTLRVVVPRKVLSSFDGVNRRPEPGLRAILAERRRGDGRAWWAWALGAGAGLAVSAGALRTARSRRLRPR